MSANRAKCDDAHGNMHGCATVCVRSCTCVRARMCVAVVCPHAHALSRARVRMLVRVQVRLRVRERVRAHVSACASGRACVHAGWQASVRLSIRWSVRPSIHPSAHMRAMHGWMYARTCMCVHVHVYLFNCLHIASAYNCSHTARATMLQDASCPKRWLHACRSMCWRLTFSHVVTSWRAVRTQSVHYCTCCTNSTRAFNRTCPHPVCDRNSHSAGARDPSMQCDRVSARIGTLQHGQCMCGERT